MLDDLVLLHEFLLELLPKIFQLLVFLLHVELELRCFQPSGRQRTHRLVELLPQLTILFHLPAILLVRLRYVLQVLVDL